MAATATARVKMPPYDGEMYDNRGLLTQGYERHLIAWAQHGSEFAMNKLISMFETKCHSEALKFYQRRVEDHCSEKLEDFVQAARLSVWEAVQKFNLSRTSRLSTFVAMMIPQACGRLLKSAQCESRGGRVDHVSTDQAMVEDGDITFGDTLLAANDDPVDVIDMAREREFIQKAVRQFADKGGNLDHRKQWIVGAIYLNPMRMWDDALGKHRLLTLDEIGATVPAALGGAVSGERVRQIRNEILRDLREEYTWRFGSLKEAAAAISIVGVQDATPCMVLAAATPPRRNKDDEAKAAPLPIEEKPVAVDKSLLRVEQQPQPEALPVDEEPAPLDGRDLLGETRDAKDVWREHLAQLAANGASKRERTNARKRMNYHVNPKKGEAKEVRRPLEERIAAARAKADILMFPCEQTALPCWEFSGAHLEALVSRERQANLFARPVARIVSGDRSWVMMRTIASDPAAEERRQQEALEAIDRLLELSNSELAAKPRASVDIRIDRIKELSAKRGIGDIVRVARTNANERVISTTVDRSALRRLAALHGCYAVPEQQVGVEEMEPVAVAC